LHSMHYSLISRMNATLFHLRLPAYKRGFWLYTKRSMIGK
jgi:hypothetical protein